LGKRLNGVSHREDAVGASTQWTFYDTLTILNVRLALLVMAFLDVVFRL
jgi:hypothetical protein